MRLEPLNWPEPEELKRRAQAFAMLDAILSPEWQWRYYSFNRHWTPGTEMGAIRDGSGNEVFMLFSEGGCILKFFDHEASNRNAPWKGQLDSVRNLAPMQYGDFFKESAFSLDYVTDVIWWDTQQRKWMMVLLEGNKMETPELLLHLVSETPASDYADWGGEYVDAELPVETVQHVLEHKPLSQMLVNQLNQIELDDLAEDIEEIGYPASDD